MASEESQHSMADSAQKDIQGAIRMGKEAAKTAKTVSKAAAQAASQNYVGAALTILKDPETMKKIIILLLLPILLFSMVAVVFLYCLPTVIFEAVESYFLKIADDWNNQVYSGGGNVFWESVWASIKVPAVDTGQLVGDAAVNTWNWIKGLFINDEGEDTGSEEDTLTDTGDELRVIQDGEYYIMNEATGEIELVMEGSEYDTLVRKINACVKKIDARADTIRSAIYNNTGSIASVVNSYYGSSYYSFSTAITVNCESLSDSGAIQILSLYTVQTGASLQEMSQADLMKWMGWNGNNLGTTTFPIGNLGVNCTVKTWKGTFVPQYIYEMMEYEKEQKALDDDFVMTDFSSYQAPAVDLLLVVDCPDIDDIPITSTSVYTTKKVKTDKVDSEGKPIYKYETEYLGEAGTAHLNITIRPRSISGLTDIVGLWDGELPS